MMVLLVGWVPVCGEVAGDSVFGVGSNGAGKNCELRNGSD
nr:hypothetical protein JVH1_2357 [Rhodococcus sp. JVH1]